jgi:hypothetical protein
VIDCLDEAEIASYRHMLAFIHSLAKELPEGELSYLSIAVTVVTRLSLTCCRRQ